MARKDATEFVDAEITELTDTDLDSVETQTAEPSVPEETATPEKTTPAAEKPKPPSAKPKVNLDDIPEFRNWKSQYDRDRAAKEKKLAELEQQVQQQRLSQLQAYEQQLREQMRTYNPDQQEAASEQLAVLLASKHMQQLQAWENYKRQRIAAEGLDPNETRWQKEYPGGEVGAKLFEADLVAAKNDYLQSENRKLKDQVGGLDGLVQTKIAEMMRSLGFDNVDTGESVQPSDATNRFETDKRRLQQGQMDPAEFLKKYG